MSKENKYDRDYDDGKKINKKSSLIAKALSVIIILLSFVSIMFLIAFASELKEDLRLGYSDNSLKYSTDTPNILYMEAGINLSADKYKSEYLEYYALAAYFGNKVMEEAYEALGDEEKAEYFKDEALEAREYVGTLSYCADNYDELLLNAGSDNVIWD